jgi:hypothetical protein
MQDALDAPPPVFVVILDEVLVARDIGLIIGDLWPHARVVIARSPEQAAGLVPDGPIHAAFVQRQARQFAGSALGQRMTRDGGLVVVVGQEPAEGAEAVTALPIPFAGADVAAVLKTLTCL